MKSTCTLILVICSITTMHIIKANKQALSVSQLAATDTALTASVNTQFIILPQSLQRAPYAYHAPTRISFFQESIEVKPGTFVGVGEIMLT